MSWHFRDTMRPARFFQFDARLSFFIVLLLVHARVWTFLLFFTVLGIFWILERKGLSFPVALRSIRVWLIGNERPAFIYTKRRKLLDTGS
ncbi:MAG: type IV secretion protein IcmT [Crenarchaeota archaeon]|nr:type IV secretion protein IcmT [Thermoproteota archaeon]